MGHHVNTQHYVETGISRDGHISLNGHSYGVRSRHIKGIEIYTEYILLSARVGKLYRYRAELYYLNSPFEPKVLYLHTSAPLFRVRP